MPQVTYGTIENTKDIGRINRKIRAQIRSAQTKEKITTLKNRSKHLVDLASSTSWKKKYNLAALKKRAKEEYELTTKVANKRITTIAKQKKK